MSIEVVVGRIGRPHGVRGDVVVEPRTDEPDRRFAVGSQLRADGDRRVLTVSAVRQHQGRLVVAFDGVSDRTAVEALRNTLLLADVDAQEQPSGPGEYWDRDLVGCEVRRADDTVAGRVIAVEHHAHHDLLQVDVGGVPRLIPFVSALVPAVNLDAGWLRIADVEGLLEDVE